MTDEGVSACATGEPLCFPNAEELRMVRAIALLALQEAARHGEYRATFHGFRVQALRKCLAPGSEAFVEVNLRVSLGKTVIERSLVATSDADAMEPKP
ncbi:MAG: hypothetical protein ACT4P8_00475 [Betaproteobacteria bacterium]